MNRNEKIEMNLIACANQHKELAHIFNLEIQSRMEDSFLKEIRLEHVCYSQTQNRIHLFYKDEYITEFDNSIRYPYTKSKILDANDLWVNLNKSEFFLNIQPWLMINQSTIESNDALFLPNIIRLSRRPRCHKFT